MKHDIVEKNLRKSLVLYGICFLFVCVSLTPAMGTTKQNSARTSEGDIPTWYTGDSWTYTVDPLVFSSPNGSFDGSIQNFKQTVTGMTDDTYTISITGDISGSVTVSGFSGDLSGTITGESHIRVSDLAEETTELHSTGTITYMWIPFDYTMDLYMSSTPALEIYDFPIQVEEWQLSSTTTITGSFTIEGILDQPFDQNQWIDETVECTAQEQVTVPAGSFECYKIGRETTLSWFSSDAGNMVKTTVDQADENMTLQMVVALQSLSHVNQPITVTEDITPSLTVPGASVILSGDATVTSSGNPVQNGAITIEIPCTGESWSTTTNSAGEYSIYIIAPTMSDDTPCGKETGSGGVIVHCNSGGLSGYRVQTLTTIPDNPPAAPSIHGPTEGKPKTSYSYTIVTADPEGDEIFYYVDWGDGTFNNWTGPYLSNENMSVSHTFTKKGTFTIKAQARDVYNAASGWGTLQVTMPTVAAAPLLKFFHRFPLLYTILQSILER